MMFGAKGLCHMCKGQEKLLWKGLVTVTGLRGIQILTPFVVKLMIIY